MLYDNSGTPYGGQWTAPHYSEATLSAADMEIGSDWQQQGMQALAVYFTESWEGTVGNDPQPIYVRVTDDMDANATLMYRDEDGNVDTDATFFGGPSHAPETKVFNIPFDSIAAEGVDLNNIASLTIGIGDPNGQVPGEDGHIVVDDIRLYIPRCLSAEYPSDLTGDCFVDYDDLYDLSEEWLATDTTVTGAAFDSNGLLVHYTFEDVDTYNYKILDSSGNDYDASMEWDADVVYSPARDSNVFEIPDDGLGHATIDGSDNDPNFDITDELTLSLWMNPIDLELWDPDDLWAQMLSKHQAYRISWTAPMHDNAAHVAFFGSGIGDWGGFGGGSMYDVAGKWSHVAGVFDINADPPRAELYVDGVLIASETPDSALDTSDRIVTLGKIFPGHDSQFQGQLDDVMIFNRALSPEEIAGLAAGEGNELTQPLTDNQQPLDILEDGTIDFRDYAVLAEKWLEEQLWP
jgi:hypothetical protein